MATVPVVGRAHVARERDVEPATDAAQVLYERHANRVFRYCYHRLGSVQEAEDAVQTTFLYAFRGLRRGVSPQLEIPWLLAIAKNVCRSRWEAARRQRSFEAVRDPEVLEETVGSEQPRHDELIRLREALARLTEQQRRAILLREWQGLSYEEIAAELGLSLSAVETLIFRARRALAEALSGVPQERRRTAVRCLDAASLGAGLKSLFGGGTAIKAGAAALAAMTALTVLAGSSPQASRRSVPGAIRATPTPVDARPGDALRPAASPAIITRAAALTAALSKDESTSAATRRSGPATSAEGADPVSDAVGGATGTVTGLTDAVAPVVDTVTESAGGAVGTVADTVGGLTQGDVLDVETPPIEAPSLP